MAVSQKLFGELLLLQASPQFQLMDMSGEGTFHQERSVAHCRAEYGRYGICASMLLHIAVLESETYDLDLFSVPIIFLDSDDDHGPELADIANNLPYDNKDSFTVKDIWFLLQLQSGLDSRPFTREQLKTDRKNIIRDFKNGTILKSHANTLLKAWKYWKLLFDSQYEEWIDRWGDSSNRQTLSCRFIDQDSEDEGYQSDF